MPFNTPFSITTNQLSLQSWKYLTEQVYTSWPEDYLPEKITNKSLRVQEEDPEEVLLELINCENAFKKECSHQLEQAQISLKKRKAWFIGTALSTVVLLSIVILLTVFFPPAAAIILPVYAAIGSWKAALLVCTLFLPSLGLSIASLIKITHCKELQDRLDKNRNVSKQLKEAQDHLLQEEAKAIQLCFETNAKSYKIFSPTEKNAGSSHNEKLSIKPR